MTERQKVLVDATIRRLGHDKVISYMQQFYPYIGSESEKLDDLSKEQAHRIITDLYIPNVF